MLPGSGDRSALTIGPGGAELAEELGLDLLGLLEASVAKGIAGEITAISVPGSEVPSDDRANPALELVLLVGVGLASPADLRRAGAAVARRTSGAGAVATSIPTVLPSEDGLGAFVEGVVLGSFGFTLRTGEDRRNPAAKLVLACSPDPDRDALERALAVAGASWQARMLATVPPNIKSPEWLAEQAVRAAKRTGLTATVWDEKRLEAEGFGGLVAVGRASATPPRMVQLGYSPGKRAASSASKGRRRAHVVLVGKGITFDSGGLNIKPGEGMVTMKRDMTGAAVVLAVLAALPDVDCPVRVTGLLPIAENAVGAAAMRPGDVIRQYAGRTTEVTNTDAEGRLVLADALQYAVARLKPTLLVDVATLTGAIKVALGQRIGGYFATDDVLGRRLEEAGAAAGEPLWRMPLAEEYEPKLFSPVADAINAPTSAQAVTAALFLRHFTGGLPWAHLDLASVGDAVKDEFEWTEGPTGFGARLLLHWLGSPDPVAGIRC
ncbi:MAG: leucyl aminopeptidase family protein [Actinomycetota bacterium]|nr:leucyl aminopeptidase family protein [Actinomycetota bacterium]